jgi:hypothetical protein
MRQQSHIFYFSNVCLKSDIDLKEKHNNSVYFLISEQGILLKAKTAYIRDNVKEEIDKFFTAKIEQLETSQSP